jgi:hypothetical protein
VPPNIERPFFQLPLGSGLNPVENRSPALALSSLSQSEPVTKEMPSASKALGITTILLQTGNEQEARTGR